MQLTTAMANALKKTSTRHEWFIWLTAMNRITGAEETVGLWSGAGEYRTTLNGEFRIYHGAGGLLNIQNITFATGLNIQSQNLTMSILDPEVTKAIRVYEPRFGKAEIHLALFDENTSIIGFAQAFDGIIDGLSIDENSDEGTCSLKLVSAMRLGTNKLYKKQSDAEQRKRGGENDAGRSYSAIKKADVWWGNKKGPNNRWADPRFSR